MIVFKDRLGKKLTWSEALDKVFNRFLNYGIDLQLFLLRFVGFMPSHVLRNALYGFVGIKIGKKSVIHMGARFYQPKNIVIGKGSIIGEGVFLDGRSSLVIGDHVDIASEVMIYNSEHDINSPDFKPVDGEVEVGDYVFIGPRAIILPGVKIGKGAVVAAGAVVTKDVPSLVVVGGVPAKEIGKRPSNSLNYKLGRARLFH